MFARTTRRGLLGALVRGASLSLVPSFSGPFQRVFSAQLPPRMPLPALPAVEPARAAYLFGSANHLEATDQRFLRLPAGASALPGVTDDWFQGFFFSADEMTQYAGNTYTLAYRGTTGHAPSGANQTGLNIRGGIPAGGAPAFSIGLAATNGASRSFFPDFARTDSIDRGAPHLVVFGQKGAFPFFALMRVGSEGRVDPALVSLQVGVDNGGAASWRYGNNGTTPQYAAGTLDFLSGFGATGDVPDGGNRRAAGGAVGGYFNVWGSFPFLNGLPDATLLHAIAQGSEDAATLAKAVGGTLRYANALAGPGDLAAHPAGTITAACIEGGSNPAAVPERGAPLRQPPALRLDTYGSGFVFAMTGTARTGSVPFAGSFTEPARADSFEARLVRCDDGRDLVGWTTLDAAVDTPARRFIAALPDVPAGVAFEREIRLRGRPELSVRDGDRQAVGLLIADVSQSQLAYQGYASNDQVGGGGGANLAPSRGPNAWLSILKQPFSLNAQTLGGGPLGNVALFQPYKAGQHGDGNIASYETLRRLLGVPVMIVDLSTPGSHPNRFSYDQQEFSFTSLFVPDGSTSIFTFAPGCSTLAREGEAGSNAVFGTVPGSLALRVGSVTVGDDGVGNLRGNGVTGGTIDYRNSKITGLSFASAPEAGTPVSGTFRNFQVAPESYQTPQAGGWSIWGDDRRPLDRTNRTGRTLTHLRRLRGAPISLYRVFWYTAMENAAGMAAFPAMMDRLKARFDAAFPAGRHALWGFGMPGRSTNINGVPEAPGQYRGFGPIQRRYVSERSHARNLGECLDLEIASNIGPHQSPFVGAITLGERLGAGVAAMFTSGLSVEGPVLAAAKFRDAGRTEIELRFDLPNGSAVVTADGSASGLQGFRIAPPGNANNGWDASGFTASIAGPATVVLRKTSGSWLAGQRVAFGNGIPVQSGGSAAEAADNAALLKMPFDNDLRFAGASKYTTRPGNLARVVDNLLVAEPS